MLNFGTGDKDSCPKRRVCTAAQEDLDHVKRGGVRASLHMEEWAKKAFLEWRQFRGHETLLSIGDLSYQNDIRPFVELLVYLQRNIIESHIALLHKFFDFVFFQRFYNRLCL